MKKEQFEQLLKSVRQAAAAENGETKPSRVFVVTNKNEVTKVRASLGLSQTKFAALLGISPGTLKNWEQGRLHPAGAAKILIKLAKQDPATLLNSAA